MSTHLKKLAGKTAVVTGASKGIGAAIAKHLAAAGASVVVNYSSSREGADRVVAAITADGGKAVAVQANVSRKADIERLFVEAAAAFGRLDILVNNAGICEIAPLGEITEEHFHRQFNLNVLGVLLSVQESLPYFGPEGGVIVNTSSVASTFSSAGTAVYNATKSAVDNLTRTFAKELGPRGIRINSVNPGPVETEGVHANGFMESFKTLVTATPLGRMGQPDDIAKAVVFLASPDAGWVHGTTLFVSGGLGC
ncbi:MAG: glucose 1-dehydrogenase [Verrucomicrobiota bacterium]